MLQMSGRVRVCLDVPAHLVILSSAISLFALVFCTMWQEPAPLFAPSFFYFFDLVQLILSPLILVLMVWKSPREIRTTVLVGLIILSAILAIGAIYEDTWAEAAFANASYYKIRPDIGVPEPWLTRLGKSAIEDREAKDSTPSGFALRQWVIMLFGLFILRQEGYQINDSLKTFLRCFFPLSFLYVGLARIFRQAHTPMDVGVSMALGTILFFLVVFIVCSIGSASGRIEIRVRRETFEIHTAFSLISMIILMAGTSNQPFFWVVASLFFIGFMGLLYRVKGFET